MKIINADNYEKMSQLGANILLDTIRNKKDASICLATGGSPARMYELFVNAINKEKLDISNVTFVKLDEWFGVEESESFTCSTFIKEHLLDKLDRQPKQLISLPTKSDTPQKECQRVQEYLDAHPLDVMILGLGMNGHLGLNEPADYLTLNTHQATLNEVTKTHDMANGHPLTSGLTIGMKGIFEAEKVLMLVCGSRKQEAYQKFMSQQITTQTPASFLWLHKNCITIIDSENFK